MALALTESAKLTQNQLQRGVIESIYEDSYLLQNLPFEEVSGNAFAYVREGALPGAAFRDVNEGYEESAGSFVQTTVSLCILGGDADVDKFIVQTRPGQVADQRAEQLRMKAKAVRLTFHNAFINGDPGTSGSETYQFEGINKMLTGTSQEITSGDAGISVVGEDDDDRHAFLDKLDETIAAVDGGSPDVLIMNRHILARLRASARRLSVYDETRDAFGKIISTYQGIPLMDAGFAADGTTMIIPQSEEYGNDGDDNPATDKASSIYAVKFARAQGEHGVLGLTNGGIMAYDLGEIDDKPVFRTRVEWYVAIAHMGVRGAAVLRGVLNS